MNELSSASEIRSYRACEQHHGGEQITGLAAKGITCTGEVKEDQARSQWKEISVFRFAAAH